MSRYLLQSLAGANTYLSGKEICIISRAHNLDKGARILLQDLNMTPVTPHPDVTNLTAEDTPVSWQKIFYENKKRRSQRRKKV